MKEKGRTWKEEGEEEEEEEGATPFSPFLFDFPFIQSLKGEKRKK